MTDKVMQLIKNMMRYSKPLKAIGRVLSVITLIYVIRFIASLVSSLETVGISGILVTFMSIAVVIGAGVIFMNAYVFKLILTGVCHTEIPYKVVTQVYVASNIYKYLPGNVMHYVSRNILANQYNMSQKSILQATVYEIIAIVSTMILFMVSAYAIIQGYGAIVVVMILTLAYICHLKGHLRLFLLLLVSAIAYNGVFILLLIGYTTDVYSYDFARVALIQSTSWLVGFITPGAPGGIGIKEFVLIQVSPVDWIEALAIVAVIHRIVMTFSDILSYFLHSIWKRYSLQMIDRR